MMTVTLRATAIRKTIIVDGITVSTTGIIQGTKSGINASIIELNIAIEIFIAKGIVMDTNPIDMQTGIGITIAKGIVTETDPIGAMIVRILLVA